MAVVHLGPGPELRVSGRAGAAAIERHGIGSRRRAMAFEFIFSVPLSCFTPGVLDLARALSLAALSLAAWPAACAGPELQPRAAGLTSPR
jgi:hypothetical protein